MKRYLCLGGAGFIGGNLALALVRDGHHVEIMDDLSNSYFNELTPGCVFIRGDIRRIEQSVDLESYDGIFNMACRNILVSWAEPADDLSVNAGGALHLFDSLRFGPKHIPVVHASSVSVHLEASPYAISKAAAERYARIYNEVQGTNIKVIRYSNVYGPRQRDGVVAKMVGAVLTGRPMVVYGDGKQGRDFVYADDAVEATIALSQMERIEHPVEVGTGTEVRIRDLANMIKEQIGGKIEYRPARPIDNVQHRVVASSFYKCRPVEEGLAAYIAIRNRPQQPAT